MDAAVLSRADDDGGDVRLSRQFGLTGEGFCPRHLDQLERKCSRVDLGEQVTGVGVAVVEATQHAFKRLAHQIIKKGVHGHSLAAATLGVTDPIGKFWDM